MVFVRFSLAYSDPDARLWRAYHSSEFRSRGWNPGWTNARYDELLEESRRSTDFEKRKALYDEAQLLLTQDSPSIFLVTMLYNYAHRDAVKGLRWIAAYGPMFAAAQVHKDPAGFPGR
jgi:ABC-type transport system substrate-binding protein